MNKESFHGLKLIAHCGGGAYGDVYYCEDISGKKMAVKIISKKKIGDSWERELDGVINYRPITESAPDLLQIFHVAEDEETFFYTMEPADSVSETEYIPDTLAYRLQSGAMPQTDLFRILSGIFKGIKLIHDAGFTHRDIKPDNILFVKGVPKLADIGLLSSLANSMTILRGTWEFLPPEKRGADASDSTDRLTRQRNDLYAFGKVIYCAVTGMDAGEYPATPADMPLSLPLKYFLRLSFELCDKEPVRRLNSIDKLEQEFAIIERKLLYGETFRDKLAYAAKSFAMGIKAAVFTIGRFLKRYWYLVFLFILLGGGVAYWIWKPEPEIDLADIKTKPFYSQHSKLSMTIPAQWEVLSEKTIKNLLAERTDFSEQEKKMLAMLNEFSKHGFDFIFCNATDKFFNNVTVQKMPLPGKEYLDRSDDELRFHVKQLFQGELGMPAEIYEIKRMTVNGKVCIFIDLSHDPAKNRINNYIFPFENHCITIGLVGVPAEFDRLKKEFEAVLKTLKFESKPPA